MKEWHEEHNSVLKAHSTVLSRQKPVNKFRKTPLKSYQKLLRSHLDTATVAAFTEPSKEAYDL